MDNPKILRENEPSRTAQKRLREGESLHICVYSGSHISNPIEWGVQSLHTIGSHLRVRVRGDAHHGLALQDKLIWGAQYTCIQRVGEAL